jgi:hypothetical protein
MTSNFAIATSHAPSRAARACACAGSVKAKKPLLV